jgi:SAM-dependent methyltransferase
MAKLTYNPEFFSAKDAADAREIILTSGGGRNADERWAHETPYLGDLLASQLGVGASSVVVDYGCGIGRMSAELIERLGCTVVGVDISPEMRAMAPDYVKSDAFAVISPAEFHMLVEQGFRADAAISVWVIQHCVRPGEDLDLLKRSLKPGARLGIVNNHGRQVPTKEQAWASDGLSVRALLEERFTEIAAGVLDPEACTPLLSENTFWAVYGR